MTTVPEFTESAFAEAIARCVTTPREVITVFFDSLLNHKSFCSYLRSNIGYIYPGLSLEECPMSMNACLHFENGSVIRLINGSLSQSKNCYEMPIIKEIDEWWWQTLNNYLSTHVVSSVEKMAFMAFTQKIQELESQLLLDNFLDEFKQKNYG